MGAETRPAQETTSTTAEAGTSNPVTNPLPDSGVGGTQQGGTTPPARRSNQLGETGAGTRRLLLLGGVALLIGAVVVAFSGREQPVPLTGGPSLVGPGRRRPRPRREIDGWEDSIPLAPGKRELARHRLGITADSYLDDEPGA